LALDDFKDFFFDHFETIFEDFHKGLIFRGQEDEESQGSCGINEIIVGIYDGTEQKPDTNETNVGCITENNEENQDPLEIREIFDEFVSLDDLLIVFESTIFWKTGMTSLNLKKNFKWLVEKIRNLK